MSCYIPSHSCYTCIIPNYRYHTGTKASYHYPFTYTVCACDNPYFARFINKFKANGSIDARKEERTKVNARPSHGKPKNPLFRYKVFFSLCGGIIFLCEAFFVLMGGLF